MSTADHRPSWRMNWMKLQGQLIGVRQARGLTQAQLADHLGKDISTIKRWEAGRNAASGQNIFRWAAALGISITTEISEGGTSATPKVSA